MSQGTRSLGSARSVYGRMKALTKHHSTPLTQHIQAGRKETARIKRDVSRKVAWQHASPMFIPYANLLEQALRQRSTHRLCLIFDRMLTEHAQQGKPTHVRPELLDRCAFELLMQMLKGEEYARDTVLEAVRHLCEINWWTRDPRRAGELWTIARAVACDLRGEHDLMARYVGALTPSDQACKLAARVLLSNNTSLEMANELLKSLAVPAKTNVKLATAFYCSAMPRYPYDTIPTEFTSGLAAFCNTIIQTSRFQKQQQQQQQQKRGQQQYKCGVDGARSVIALAHLYAVEGNSQMLDRCLRQFSALTDTAQWPMGALATATRKLVSTGQTASACQLLQTSASMDHRGFTQCLATLRTLGDPELKLAFVRDELSFRLYAHRLASYDTSPPAAAFFVPALSIRIDDPGIRDAVKQYYTDINGLLARAEPSTVERLVSEAGAWCFRLQNTEPIALLTHHLIASASDLSDDDCAGLLTAYLRTLRNFHMLHYTSRTQQAANKASRTTPRPLSATCVGQPGHSAYFTDIMSTFAATRTAILAEYLRRGIEPSIEALAILHSHLAACGHAAESHGLAATILPLIPPSATGQYAPGRLAAQAYYEHMLLSLAEQPRRMLQLFEHVLGHHNVDVPEFRHRMVDQTVTLYIRHGHFAGFGFFRLERPFIRLVNRPWFSTAYLNRVRPRFWALHMFLRQRRYVPRLRLHNKQLRIHKLDIYTMGVTAIPSPAKMKAQKVDLSIAPICTEDIHTALNIFLNSIPRNKLGPGIWSTDWMLKHQTKMVVSSGS